MYGITTYGNNGSATPESMPESLFDSPIYLKEFSATHTKFDQLNISRFLVLTQDYLLELRANLNVILVTHSEKSRVEFYEEILNIKKFVASMG